MPDDTDGLFQHFMADIDRLPFIAQDMLVQIFAGADAQKEPAFHEQARGGSRLCDDGWVDAGRRASDACAQTEFRGSLGDCANHTPDKGAVPLPVDPRMIMVGDERETKANLFGTP